MAPHLQVYLRLKPNEHDSRTLKTVVMDMWSTVTMILVLIVPQSAPSVPLAHRISEHTVVVANQI